MNTQLVIIDKHIDLRNSHRELLENFMKTATRWELKQRTLVLRLYDKLITPENIIRYYNRNIKLFLIALVTDRLEDIENYFHRE